MLHLTQLNYVSNLFMEKRIIYILECHQTPESKEKQFPLFKRMINYLEEFVKRKYIERCLRTLSFIN